MCRSQCSVCISIVIIHVFIKLSERQDTLKSANRVPSGEHSSAGDEGGAAAGG